MDNTKYKVKEDRTGYTEDDIDSLCNRASPRKRTCATCKPNKCNPVALICDARSIDPVFWICDKILFRYMRTDNLMGFRQIPYIEIHDDQKTQAISKPYEDD